MPTDPARTCSECGAELPAGTAPGQCPNCLLGLGLATKVEPGEGQKAEVDSQPDADDPSRITHRASRFTSFGDYDLLEEIGRGGMGVVYKARQKSLDRVVGLKLLLFGPHAPPESVKRFRAEAVATAALQHPNIVAIHEVGVCEGQHFLVMDFVEGRSLARVISDFGFQISDFKRPAGYLKTIAEAIHYAHERGLLHRDLKPSNILIDANDQPRVTDFGLAKRLEGDSELTVSGQVLGSPNYMPPEQATGKRGTVSRRSDVYALGAILYQALTGRPPFVGEGPADTVHQVLNVEPASPRSLNPRLPADLETVCLKCLEKEPGKRYATAQLVAEELGRFLEGKPVLARPVGRLAKAGRWCQRNPRLAMATGAVLLSLLIGLGGVTWQWRRAERIAHAEARQRVRAEEQTALAEAEALLTRRHAYAADMKEVPRALDDNDLGRARELLNRHRPDGKAESSKQKTEIDLRGWEWRYLWARCQSDERSTLCQYSNSVSALAYSADGKWLAVRQEAGVLALWDTLARRPVTNLPARAVRWRWCNKALAFSPRGNRLAWATTDSSGAPILSLRDVGEQKEFARLPHSADVVSVAFAPDAKVLATLDYDGTVRVWDVESQQVVTNFLTAPVDWDQLFAAGKVTASAEGESTGVVWETNSPPVRRRITRSRAYTDHYGCVLFSPNGRWLAVGEAQPRIRLLNQVTGELREIPVPTTADGITTLALSPDSQRLAAGFAAGDTDIHVWELGTGAETRLAGHSGWIVGLAFSPDGQTLASASTDQTLGLWDVTGKVEPRRLKGNTDEVWALAWSPDGNNLVTGAKDGSVRYWDPAAKASAPYAVVPEDVWFWGPAFLPDSKTFLTVTLREGEVVRCDAVTARVVERMSFLGTNHLGLDLSSDGRWLAIGDKVGNLQVWDFQARQLVANMALQGTAVFALMFSPHGSMLNGGFRYHTDRRTVTRFWSVADWREISLRGIDLTRLFEPAYSADEKTLAIGHTDGTAAWWDLQTGQKQGPEFGCDSARVVNVAFSLDGQWFATGGIDGRMLLWDVATRRPKPIGRGHRNELQDVAFSPDGQRLIASGSNPKYVVKLWDVETGRDLATLPGKPGWYPHIGFSPDGNTLFAASLEGRALLWRAPSWQEIEVAEDKKQGP
jgi:eukaryotic-like serine/threonine-protein kinase